MVFLMVWILKKTGSVTWRVPAFDELEFMSDLGSSLRTFGLELSTGLT
jgi:hypothetical protein